MFLVSGRITGQPCVMAIVAFLAAQCTRCLFFCTNTAEYRLSFRKYLKIISLLWVFSRAMASVSLNAPHHAWCLLIPQFPQSQLVNEQKPLRSSWTGNPIIVPFYVLGWHPHPQLCLIRCGVQMFPKGLWLKSIHSVWPWMIQCHMDYII